MTRAKLSTQTFEEAGGNRVFGNLSLERTMAFEYVLRDQAPMVHDHDPKTGEWMASSPPQGDEWLDTLDEILYDISKSCYELGYSHVFNLKIKERKNDYLILGDCYYEIE